MKYSIIDISVVAAIVACTYYVWKERGSTAYVLPEEAEGDYDEAEIEADVGLAVENFAHPARNCDACGSKGSVIVLEITYSGLRPLTTEEADTLGDELLERLFKQCTCSITDDMCFQWTLTINQMNYSKTDTGLCQGYQCKLNPAEMFPGIRMNVTLGEIHVVTTHVMKRECLQQTVQCALYDLNPKITEDNFVQAVISSEDYKST